MITIFIDPPLYSGEKTMLGSGLGFVNVRQA
jgi:hypothetical protein